MFHLFLSWSSIGYGQKIAGSLVLKERVAEGYTLFAPLNVNSTYLIDNCGRIINEWKSNFPPGNTAYLMPNGNLLRTRRLANSVITGGGGGGGVELRDWNDNLIWSFTLNTDLYRLHHDISFLPNGNILMIVWESKTREEALAAGRKSDLLPSNGIVWSEQIIEVRPIPPNSSEIVWKWSLWDHVVQDFDDTKSGFGVIADHPELVNINYVPGGAISDWIHANAIDYNENLDQIILSSPFLSELWIIDHSTTTEEAATHSGGNSNKGGDLLYRWGNPTAYQRGTSGDQKIFGQHDVHWVKQGQYKDHIILFNNEIGADYSSVDIIKPPVNSSKTYDLDQDSYLPELPVYTYMSNPREKLYSQIMAGAQMLPNGNLLICSSRQGVFFEVTQEDDTVWFYKSPVTVSGIIGRDILDAKPDYKNDLNFRTIKYSSDYSAFVGRDITPKEPIEGEPWACDLVTSVIDEPRVNYKIYPNPVERILNIEALDRNRSFSFLILDLYGREVENGKGTGKTTIDLTGLPSSLYILIIDKAKYKVFMK